MMTTEISEGLREYEISYLLTAPEHEALLQIALSGRGVKETGGQPLRAIPLAYPINKHESAHLGVKTFKSDRGQIVSEINDELKLKPEILRFLVVAVPPKPAPLVKTEIEDQKIEKSRTATVSPPPDSLTNEALEQKLEEILRD